MKQAAAVIVENEKGEVLLFQRGAKARSHIGKWENCGGAVEENESPEDAAIREYKEETGADIEIVDLIFNYTDEEGWNGFIFKGRLLTDPQIIDKDVCSEIRWVKKGDLKNMELTPYAKSDFEKLGWL